MKQILMATVFTLFFTLDCSLAEETQNPSREDFFLLIEKIDKILQEKDYEKFRMYYPHFLEMLSKFWKQIQESSKDLNVKDERDNAVDFAEFNNEDISKPSAMRFLSALLNSEENKRKRGYHRALCHFKICNMGSKRSNNFWEMWRNNQQ